MNYDDLAIMQRALAARQSERQHREAQEKLADVEAQLRIANLPPEQRAAAARRLEEDRIRSDQRRQAMEKETDWESVASYSFLGFLILGAIVCFFVAIIDDRNPKPAYSFSSTYSPSSPSLSEETERLRGMEAERIERERAGRAQAAQAEAERATEEQAARVAQEQVKKEDLQKRLYVFRLKRANDGAAEAQYDLALQYLTGQGVARDITAAKDWLQKAAAQGHKKAQKQLELLGATDAPASPK